MIQGRGAARPATALPTTFRRRFKGASAGYLLIAPAIVVSVVFLLIPMVVSAYWSLTHYNGIQAPQFVGLQNYQEVLSNPRFQRSFQNTVFFVVMGMSIGPSRSPVAPLPPDKQQKMRASLEQAGLIKR